MWMQPVGTADVPGMCQAVGVDGTTDIYFLSKQGRVIGPFDVEFLRLLQENHRLNDTDRVWLRGLPGWMTLGEAKQKMMCHGFEIQPGTAHTPSRRWTENLALLAGVAGILIFLIMVVPCWVFLLFGLICWGSKCK